MADYTPVYDPANEMFEVPHERAALLVLNEGWSWEPRTFEPVQEEAIVAPRRKRAAPVEDTPPIS